MFIIKDLSASLKYLNFIRYKSYVDLKLRFNRTLIGSFWPFISISIFVLGWGFAASSLFSVDPSDFLPYFCTGYITWLFLSSNVSESCNIFISQTHILLTRKIPFSVFIFIQIVKNFFIFLHYLLFFLIIFLYFNLDFNYNFFLLIPGFFIFFFLLYFFIFFWGTLCTRFRDLGEATNSVLSIAFFLSPIIWPIDKLSGYALKIFVDFNPLYHLISVIRLPLMGESPELFSYFYLLILLITQIVFTFILLNKTKEGIKFWL